MGRILSGALDLARIVSDGILSPGMRCDDGDKLSGGNTLHRHIVLAGSHCWKIERFH